MKKNTNTETNTEINTEAGTSVNIKKMGSIYLKNLTLSAMFLALGLILPIFTGQIPRVGNMLLPMHIPVLLCGLICGWQYGAVVGFVTPLLRSVLFGMPILYPMAIGMAFELMTYGLVVGYVYGHSKWKCIISLYRAMIISMITGRLVWGIAQIILLGIAGNSFTLQAFMAGAFINAVPGIVIQLILIPTVMVALGRAHLVEFGMKKSKKAAANEQ